MPPHETAGVPPLPPGPGAVPAAGPAVPAPTTGVVTPGALLTSLRRRWLLALSVGLTVSATAAATTWFALPVKFTASSVLHVAAEEPRILGGPPGAGGFGLYQLSQSALMKSRPVLNTALHKEGVANLPMLPPNPEQQIEWLQGELQVDYKTGPVFLRVSLSGDQPDGLKLLVDAVVEAYFKEVVSKERTDKTSQLAKLKDIQAKYEQRLQNRREDLKGLVQAARAPELGPKQRQAADALALAEKELLQVQSDRRRANEELKTQQARLKADPTVSEAQVARELDKHPAVLRLLAQQDQLEEVIGAKEGQFVKGKDEPAMKPWYNQRESLAAELKKVRDRLRPEVQEQLQTSAVRDLKVSTAALEERVEFLKNWQTTLEDTINRLQDKAQAANVRQVDIDAFESQIGYAERMAERVGSEVELLQVELDAPRRVNLLEEASVSQTTTPRQRFKFTAVAGLLGLLLPVILIALWEYRFRRIASARDVTRDLGLRVVGAVPPPARRPSFLSFGRDRHSEEDRQSLLTESVDTTRTNLIHAARVANARVLLITSAMSGEGKTSLASRLAASMARAGHRVLLIDGDLRRPDLHTHFGLPSSPGLNELLRGEVELDAVVLPSGVENLSVLPGGGWDAQSTRGLSGPQLPAHLKILRERFDYTVIDSAPVLPVADTLAMAQQVDGVVLAVLCEVSQQPLVAATAQRLAAVGARLLGAVVNGDTLEGSGSYYPGSAYRSYRARTARDASPEPSGDGPPAAATSGPQQEASASVSGEGE